MRRGEGKNERSVLESVELLNTVQFVMMKRDVWEIEDGLNGNNEPSLQGVTDG